MRRGAIDQTLRGALRLRAGSLGIKAPLRSVGAHQAKNAGGLFR
jgi:hypothetical protein